MSSSKLDIAAAAYSRIKPYLGCILYSAGWFLFLALLYQVYVSLSFHFSGRSPGLWFFFSSDTLCYAAAYEDLFINNASWSGWHVANSPQYFSMFLYFLCRLIGGSAAAAHTINAMLFPVLLTLSMEFAAVSFLPKATMRDRATVVLSGALIVFLMAFYRPSFLLPYFWVCRHGEVTVMLFLGMGMLIRAIHSEKYIWIGILTLICVIAVIGDLLFVVAFIVPGIILLVFLSIIRNQTYRRTLLLMTVLVVSTVIGRVFAGLTGHRDTAGIYASPSFAKSFSSGAKLISDIKAAPAVDFWLAITALMFVLIAVIFILNTLLKFKSSEQSPQRLLMFSVFLLCSSASVIGSVVLTENTKHPGYFRYLITIFALSFIAAPVYLAASAQKVKHSKYVVIVFIALLLISTGCKWKTIKPDTIPVYKFYPSVTRDLDNNAARYGLSCGISDHWLANYNTQFSKQGLRIYPVQPNLNPSTSVCNINWHLGENGVGKASKPVYNFVILGGMHGMKDGLKEETVIKAFGTPAGEFIAGGHKVLVYNRPEDSALRNHFEKYRDNLLSY